MEATLDGEVMLSPNPDGYVEAEVCADDNGLLKQAVGISTEQSFLCQPAMTQAPSPWAFSLTEQRSLQKREAEELRDGLAP